MKACKTHKWITSKSTRKGTRKICNVCGLDWRDFIPENAQRTGDMGRVVDVPTSILNEMWEFDSEAHSKGRCRFSSVALCSAIEHEIKMLLRGTLSWMLEEMEDEKYKCISSLT